MKVVKILGSGCCSCDGVKKAFEEVIVENKLHVKIEKIEDIMEIMKYDVMSTPGIVIDEKVVMTGKTPTKQEIEALILDNFHPVHVVQTLLQILLNQEELIVVQLKARHQINPNYCNYLNTFNDV